jgi:hypothetical protein
MNNTFYLLFLGIVILFSSCKKKKAESALDILNWKNTVLTQKLPDSLVSGSSYLSVYSQIYSETEHITHDLTATISIRNTSRTDTIFVTRADYFNTKGGFIKNYIGKTIYLKPLETAAIVINEKDKEGGTGANFVFDWKTKKNTSEPLFEGIMISTSGSQGLSFTTQGKKIE